MRAVALHPDVLVVTSAVLHVNCVVVRGGGDAAAHEGREPAPEGRPPHLEEAFVIDSPVLPEELDALPALVEQARFPSPGGLLATHGDWDHLLARLAFPGLALGCAETTAARLAARPGEAQRRLREFDEQLYLERERPLSLGSVQALPVPGRLELGCRELELHPTDGHTEDGMALWIGWAAVLVAGDHLSSIEIPTLGPSGMLDAYLATLERLRPLVEQAERVVPGHGPVLEGAAATRVLEEDLAYLRDLRNSGAAGELPPGRRSREQRRRHDANAAAL